MLIGHSAGAALAYEAALSTCQAYVQMGSTLNSAGVFYWQQRSLVQFPKPILTLLGERDGYLRMTGGALEWEEVERARSIAPAFASFSLSKSVVLLPGVSHEQVSHAFWAEFPRAQGM